MANVKNYVHPHISSSIIDNSEVTTLATSATTITGTILYTPIVAGRGKDNVHQLFVDAGAFIAEYGEPNFKKYGQTMYNALRWLLAGGQVRAIRVTPTDAAAAQVSVHAKVAGVASEVKMDGSNTDALFTIKCKGRGAYGNNYSVAIVNNDAFASTYDFPLYTVSVYEKTSIGTKVVEGPYLVSLKPDSVTKAGKPLFIKSVFETYSTNFEVDFNEDAYYAIIEGLDAVINTEGEEDAEKAYETAVATAQSTYDTAVETAKTAYDAALEAAKTAYDEDPEAEGASTTYDAALEAAKTAYDAAVEAAKTTYDSAVETALANLEAAAKYYDVDDAETVDFICGDKIVTVTGDLATPVALTGGSDGSVAEKVLWKDVKETYEELFKGAFCVGNPIDESILEWRNYPIDVLLDASFDVTTKRAVQQFQEMRGDCFAFLAVDPENAATFNDVMTYVNNYVADGANGTIARNYATALYGQSFVCADTYSGGDIAVDFTYILASMIPEHDLAYGSYVPMAGARRGVITGFKKISFNPNDEQQDTLYRAKVNYAMQTTAGTRINSNLTLQDKNSALSNINNVRTCYKIIRAVEDMSDKYEFEFADTDTFNAFQNELNSTLASFSSAVKSLVGTVYQTEYDKEQKIARIRLEVVFKDILERIIIELNVGR